MVAVAVARHSTAPGVAVEGSIMLTSEQVDDLAAQMWADTMDALAGLYQADGRPDVAHALLRAADLP